ncbi:MAG: cell division protein FtsL [Myxococcales bacterium]|nr:cell division protein FtsL [Myxococcales bacterium]
MSAMIRNRRREAEVEVAAAASAPALRKKSRAAGPSNGLAARFLMLWIAAVVATVSAFVVHLAMRHEVVRLGLEVDAARREQRRLVEDQRLLSIEAASLRHAPRVEAVARGQLQMDVPAPERIVPAEGEARRSRRTAGRVR